MKVKLTEKLIRAAKWNGAEQRLVDSSLPGFFVSVNKGSKTYKIKADLWVGETGRKRKVRTITHAIARFEQISLRDARAQASDLLNQIHSGKDPFRAEENRPAASMTVGDLVDSYIADRVKKGRAEDTIFHYEDLRKRYLERIAISTVSEFTAADLYDLHDWVTHNHGPSVANKAIKLVGFAFKFGRRRARGANFPDNPAAEFEYNPANKNPPKALDLYNLENWYQKVRALQNPLRRDLHLLCVFSGLRRRSVCKIEKDWINLDRSSIAMSSGQMKGGRDFLLPLSTQMKAIVARAAYMSDRLYPESKWLFPTRSKAGEVVPVQEIKEKTMPGQVGHVLRRTHRTVSQKVGISDTNAMLLLDHTIKGISGRYVDTSQIFQNLLKDQQRISDEITSLLGSEFSVQLPENNGGCDRKGRS